MREIVLDTETTGLDPRDGHRIVEIACMELVNHVPTGKVFHTYLNPERAVPEQAFAVHGLSESFLKDHPLFTEVYTDFLDFIEEDRLVIHNASFDLKFLNAELGAVGVSPLPKERAIDTLMLARQKFPGAQASLDALCRRFQIDNSNRELHGALIDTELLAKVYLELIGGKQAAFGFGEKETTSSHAAVVIERPFREARPFAVTEEELLLHANLVEDLKAPLWKKN